MIPLYFCSCAVTDERLKMAEECFIRWKQEKVDITILQPTDIEPLPFSSFPSHRARPSTLAHFQRARRIYPPEDLYILTDDDCLLPPDFNLEGALSTFNHYPEFSILSLLPLNANIYPWTPEDFMPANNSDILEHVDVGNVRFCRKIELDWPPLKGTSYDRAHCEAIRARGSKVGYFKNHFFTHLGEGKTTLCPR